MDVERITHLSERWLSHLVLGSVWSDICALLLLVYSINYVNCDMLLTALIHSVVEEDRVSDGETQKAQ